jgi:hypothetical protein
MGTETNPLSEEIAAALARTPPRSRARNAALAAIKWVLAAPDGSCMALDRFARPRLTMDADEALVFDGRDNEELKARFFQIILGMDLTVVLLDPAKTAHGNPP